MPGWEFWIDVGGTFTDCLARHGDSNLLTCKVLSSGATKGRVARYPTPMEVADVTRGGDPPGFWVGYTLRLLSATGEILAERRIVDSQPASPTDPHGSLLLDTPLPEALPSGLAYELDGGEPAPILAIRTILKLPLAATFLLDTFHAAGFGGSGKTGDWAKFARYRETYPQHTWILAGGLSPDNVAEAVAQSGAFFVDVNSGVETSPGVKDHAKLRALGEALAKRE